MLKIEKNIVLTGSSLIEGVMAEGYQATIDSKNPENMTMSSWQSDRTAYKVNREVCRKDKAAFEDAAYELQDAMIAEKEAEGQETDEKTE